MTPGSGAASSSAFMPDRRFLAPEGSSGRPAKRRGAETEFAVQPVEPPALLAEPVKSIQELVVVTLPRLQSQVMQLVLDTAISSPLESESVPG